MRLVHQGRFDGAIMGSQSLVEVVGAYFQGVRARVKRVDKLVEIVHQAHSAQHAFVVVIEAMAVGEGDDHAGVVRIVWRPICVAAKKQRAFDWTALRPDTGTVSEMARFAQRYLCESSI